VRERVGRLGGTVGLVSRPGAGVTVTVELPG
jgi:signal transduction histidine kinase